MKQLRRPGRLQRLAMALGAVAPLLLGSPVGAPSGDSRAWAGKAPDAATKEKVKKLFDEGMVQYDLRKFEEAIKIFEQAFSAYPDPVFLYNIAQSHRMAGHSVEAIAFYKNYLRKVPDAANATEIKGWIAQLEKAPPPAPTAAPLPPLPPPVPYLEPRSKHNYLTRLSIGGKDYSLTGVSRRTYLGFLLYGVGMYVEEEPARRAFPKLVEKAGGSYLQQLRARDLAQNFIVLGEFGKAAVLYFARDIAANKIRDSYRDMLKDNLKPSVPPELRKHTEEFLALFDRDVQKGEEMIIQTTGDGVASVSVGGVRKDGPKDPTLCIDLWNLWIGQKAISEDMKQGLVERIPALGGTPAEGAGK